MAKKKTETTKSAAEKTAAKAVKPDLVPGKVYEIEAIKDGKHLQKGKKYKVTGEIAAILLEKKAVKVIG